MMHLTNYTIHPHIQSAVLTVSVRAHVHTHTNTHTLADIDA